MSPLPYSVLCARRMIIVPAEYRVLSFFPLPFSVSVVFVFLQSNIKSPGLSKEISESCWARDNMS